MENSKEDLFQLGKPGGESECLELLHADLCGPMQRLSLGGCKLFFLLIDDYSRMSVGLLY